MKKSILQVITFFACITVYGQISNSDNPLLPNMGQFNNSTGSYDNTIISKSENNKLLNHKSANFIANCASDFWTVNDSGRIQQWSLINNSIIGGNVILTGGGRAGLAYCNNAGVPTFYCSNYPNTGITFYDTNNNWVNIPTSLPVLNNAGYQNHQYYMGTVIDSVLNYPTNKIIYYFNGINLRIIDSLSNDYFSVADIAVDTLGRAWVFKGNALNSVNSLNVYDSAGFVSSYAITFNTTIPYGSFFLQNTLYLGMGDSISPIIINGNTAQLGTSIPFPYFNYYDMASCQNISNLLTLISESNYYDGELSIFPNPTRGLFFLPSNLNPTNVEIYNLDGQLIMKNQKIKFDLSDQPSGIYIIKIYTKKGAHIRKILKN